MPPVSSRCPPPVDALEPRVLFARDIIISETPLPGPSPAMLPPAIRVTVDYRYDAANFFDTPAKRDALQRAADGVVRLLADRPGPIQPAAPYAWEATFEDPATGQPVAARNLIVNADEIILYPGARELDGGVLSLGGPGGFTTADTPPEPIANLAAWARMVRFREPDGIVGTGAADVPWGGSLTFEATPDLPWHFDPATQPPAGAYDFPTAAARAVAHVLGFGTTERWVDWVTAEGFRGPEAMAFGRTGDALVPVPVDPSGRWLADADAPGAPASAMRATLKPGERLALTPLDYAALRDVGRATTNRVSLSLPARGPAGAASPVLFDLVFESATGPWAPERVAIYPYWLPVYADRVGEPVVVSPTAQRVTYAFEPPGGTWEDSELRRYTVALDAGPEAGTVGTFTVDPGTPPYSSLQTWPIRFPSAVPWKLAITHGDNDALDPTSLAADDIAVVGPGGAELAVTWSQPAPGSVGSSVWIDFFAHPPGGTWGPEDNGTYTVARRPGRLRDVAGNVSAGGVLGTLEVAIAPSALRRRELRDNRERIVTAVTLSGPGTVLVYPAAETGGGLAGTDIDRIVLEGTTEASTLRVRARAGTYVKDIVATGPIGGVVAPTLRLDGALSVAGALRRLRLGGTGAGATIRLGPGRVLAVAVGHAADLTFESESPVRSLTVGRWLKTSNSADSKIVAPSIRTIASLDRQGAFEADVVTGSLGRARFAGTLRNATLRAADSIGSVTAAHVDNSRIFAGVGGGATVLPASAAEFVNPAASIKAVSVKGAFFASAIAAPTVGRVLLETASAGSGGKATGVAAGRIAALVETTRSLRLTRLDDPADSRVEGDLTIRLL